MNKYIILRQIENEKPFVNFMGSKTEAKARMFDIILNSEGKKFETVDNDEGYEFKVNESRTEVMDVNGKKKSVPVIKTVTYFMYLVSESNN